MKVQPTLFHSVELRLSRLWWMICQRRIMILTRIVVWLHQKRCRNF